LFNENEGVYVRNIIPDGKKLATYGQCQWDLTSVAFSVTPFILRRLILQMSRLQLSVAVHVKQPVILHQTYFYRIKSL
jgi:hypothetical protein